MANGSGYEVAAGYVSLYARMESKQTRDAINNAINGVMPSVGKSFASSFTNSVGGALTGIGKVTEKIGKVLTVGLGAGVAGAAKMAKSMVDIVSNAENTTIAFKALSGAGIHTAKATQYASDAMGRLNDFAILTPYEFNGVAKSASKLVAMGYDINDLIQITGTGSKKVAKGLLADMGDWAAALGLTDEGYQNVLTQMGHIKTTGHLYTRQMTALTNNGLAAWEALQEYYADKGSNYTIAELRKMTTAGEISSEVAIEALQKYASKFSGAMQDMSLTFSGVMSNMNDAISVPIQSLKDTSAYSAMTRALYNLTNPIRNLTTAVMPVFEEIMQRVAGVLRGALPVVQSLTKRLEATDPKKVVDGLEGIAAVLGSGPLLIGLGKFEQFLGKFITKGNKAASVLAGPLVNGFKVLQRVPARLSTLWNNASISLKTNVLGSLGNIREKFADASETVQLVFMELKDTFGSRFKELGDTIFGKYSKELGTRIGGAADTIKRVVRGKFVHAFDTGKEFVSLIKDGVGQIGRTYSAMFHDMMPTVSGAWDSVVTAFKGGIGKVSDAIGVGVLKMDIGITKFFKDSKNAISTAWQKNVVDVFKPLGERVGSAVASVKTNIGTALSNVKTTVSGKMSEISKAVKGSELSQAFSSVFTKAKYAFKGFGQFIGQYSGVLLESVGGAFSSVTGAAGRVFSKFMSGTAKAAQVGIEAFAGFSRIALVGGSVFGVLALGASAAFIAFEHLGGYLPNLGASINTTLVGLGGKVSSAMTDIIASMQQMVDQNQIGQFFNSVNYGIQSFIGSVASQAPTFMSAFRTVFQQVLTGIVGMFVTYAPMLLSGAIQLFTGLIDGLTTVIQTLTPMLPQLIQNIGGALAANMPALLTAGLNLFLALVDAFTTSIPVIVAQIPGFISTFSNWLVKNFPRLMNGATQLFNAIADALPVVIPEVLSGLVKLLERLISSFPKWGPKFLAAMGKLMGNLAKAIIKALPDLLKGLASILGELIANIPTFVQGFVEGGKQLVAGIAEGLADFDFLGVLSSVADAIINGFKSLFGIASPSTVMAEYGGFVSAGLGQGMQDFDFGSAVESVKSAITGFFSGAKDWLSSKGKSIAQGLSGGMEKGKKLASNAGTTVKGAITGVYNNAKSFLSGAGRNISQGLSNGINGAKSFASNAGRTVKGAVTSVYNGAKSFLSGPGRNISQGLASGINGARSVVGHAGNSIKGAVKNVFSGARSMLYSAGTSVASGLANGIKAGLSWVTSAARNLAKSAVNAAKAHLRVGSPSRVFHEIGGFVDQGFANGITDSQWLVNKAVGGMTASMLDFDPTSQVGATWVGSVASAIEDASGGDALTADDIAAATASAMSRVQVLMDPTSTASMLAPSMNKELGRLQYMGV